MGKIGVQFAHRLKARMGIIDPALMTIQKHVAFAFDHSAQTLLVPQYVANRIGSLSTEWTRKQLGHFPRLLDSRRFTLLSIRA